MRMPLSFKLPRILALCLLILLCAPRVLAQTPVVTITPDSGEVESALLAIHIEGLAANSAYRVEFVYAGQVIVGSDEMSDGEGRISFPAGSTEGDLPGIYSVRVLRDGVALASADFELLPKAGSGEITVTPASGPVGTLHEIQVSGLARNATYIIQISASETGQEVYQRERVSDDRGRFKIEVFAESGDATGAQAISVSDAAGNVAATGGFQIDPAGDSEIGIALDSAAVAAGEAVALSVTGLPASASVTAQLKSAADVLIDTAMARATAAGAVNLSIATPRDLSPGAYRVEVFVEGDLAGGTSITLGEAVDAPAAAPERMTAASVARATIQPQAAPIGSSHRITVTGLNADEAVEFDVVYAGASVYRTDKTADSAGAATLELLTDSGDQPGDYTIRVLRAAGNEPSVVLRALSAAAAAVDLAGVTDFSGRLQSGGARVSFAAAAGQVLVITLEAEAFAPGLRLTDPSGAVIGEAESEAGSNSVTYGPLRFAAGGDYALEIYALSDAALDGARFNVSVSPVSLTALTFDTPLAFTLSPEAPAQYYAMAVASGDRLNLSVDSGGSLDTLLRVIAPDGRQIAMDDDSGRLLDAEISNLQIETAGEYMAAVTTFDGIALGSGSLTAQRNAARALEPETVIVTLSDKMIRDLVVFDAAEDELLVLRLDKLAGDVMDLFVTATVDGMEVMSYSTMGVPDELPLPFVMPMAGQVLVTLEKLGVADGISLAVSLQRP